MAPGAGQRDQRQDVAHAQRSRVAGLRGGHEADDDFFLVIRSQQAGAVAGQDREGTTGGDEVGVDREGVEAKIGDHDGRIAEGARQSDRKDHSGWCDVPVGVDENAPSVKGDCRQVRAQSQRARQYCLALRRADDPHGSGFSRGQRERYARTGFKFEILTTVGQDGSNGEWDFARIGDDHIAGEPLTDQHVAEVYGRGHIETDNRIAATANQSDRIDVRPELQVTTHCIEFSRTELDVDHTH